jgi:hypothetical protein
MSVQEHLHILGRGTAQLIGNSCQCAAILSGHAPDSPIALACLQVTANPHCDTNIRTHQSPPCQLKPPTHTPAPHAIRASS